MLKIYKTIIMVCIAFCNMTSYAQNYNETSDEKEITLIVSGDGVNKEKATMTALRSAIEQAFGAFVSSNTKLLNDDEAYFGTQVECEFNNDEYKSCFGLLANMNFILVCEYGENGSNPEILIYKKR